MKHSVEEITLKNGSRGLVVQVPGAQVANIEISFRAGDFLTNPQKWEVPHLMEHMVPGASERFPKARLFQAQIEKNGAYTNASTSAYDITYEAECADFEWQRVLELLLYSISNPMFLEAEFKAEYGNVREELTSRANNHYRELRLKMNEKTGFVARADKERLKLMKNVTLSDISAHWRRTHGTNNMRFVIGGNFTPTRLGELRQMLENVALPKGRRYVLPNEHPKTQKEPILIRNRTIDNMYFYLDTFFHEQLSDDELDSIELANTMLTETLYSRILGTARERGIAYDMGSGVNMTKNATDWFFGAQVSRDNATQLIDLTVQEVSKLMAGDIDEGDIEAAKLYSLGRFQRGAQTVRSAVSGYSSRYFFDEVIEDFYRIPERVRSVTKDSMTVTANKMFSKKVWAFGVLGGINKELVEDLYGRASSLWQ